MTEPTASPDVTELIERLRTHALGPKTCQDCGRDRADPDTTLCRQEGQCDFIRHNGTHTSAIDDPWKFKEDVLVAADVLLALRQEVEPLTRERDEARETNRSLNRVNQKLQSDMAADKHLLAEYDPADPAQILVEGRDGSAFKRDSALLYYGKQARDNLARAEAAEAALRQAPDAEQGAGELGPDGKELAKTEAGYRHVESVLASGMEGQAGLVWYGHAVREAFVAGAEWQERRVPTQDRG